MVLLLPDGLAMQIFEREAWESLSAGYSHTRSTDFRLEMTRIYESSRDESVLKSNAKHKVE
jgi:hypothetical protein